MVRVAALAVVGAFGCGRIGFDPAIEGTWAYSSQRAIYLYNDIAPSKTIAITENTPIAFAGDARYAVAPSLTAATGLTLDPVTGVISGRPTRTSPPTDYIVTARTADELRTTVVSIRTAPGFYVNDLGDAGDLAALDDDCVTAGGRCTLRAALGQLAAFDATPRVVLIPAGTILLAGNELLVVQPAELIGAGRDATVIDAADASRALELGDDNTVIISDLTLQHGNVPDDGGCVHALGGTLTLRDVAIRNCTSASNGAGVFLWDDFNTRKVVATIEHVTFDQNRGSGPTSTGGALLLSTGGPDSSAAITGCTFSNNTTMDYGGALAHPTGPITITESLFEGNDGGGALAFQNNTDVTLVNTTIVGNHGVSGYPGGLYSNNFSVIRMVNDTISGNTCAGGCFNGGGVLQNTGGMLTLRNTIIAGNLDLTNGTVSNCNGGGTRISLGHNLLDSPDNGLCVAATAGDQFGIDPQLEPLAEHGGPTRTAAIGAASPAYNAATNTECPATDQRGLGFPRPAAGTCDIGAFEVQ